MKKQAPKDLEKRADVALDKRILNVMRAKLNSTSVLMISQRGGTYRAEGRSPECGAACLLKAGYAHHVLRAVYVRYLSRILHCCARYLTTLPFRGSLLLTHFAFLSFGVYGDVLCVKYGEEAASSSIEFRCGEEEKGVEKTSLEVIPKLLSATLSEWGRPHALSHPVNQPRHPGFNVSTGGRRLRLLTIYFLKKSCAQVCANMANSAKITSNFMATGSEKSSKEMPIHFLWRKSSYQLSHTRFDHKSPPPVIVVPLWPD